MQLNPPTYLRFKSHLMDEFGESESIEYLGGVLHRDERAGSEISRKLGIAVGDFKQLQKLWGQASVSNASCKFLILCGYHAVCLGYDLLLHSTDV